jgi:hypothetical protein
VTASAQYMGFESKAVSREYAFLVREALVEPVKITFAILNKAFTTGRLSFQNAPDLCSLKLHREMADCINGPLKAHYKISETEMDEYQRSHLSKTARGTLHVRRPLGF